MQACSALSARTHSPTAHATNDAFPPLATPSTRSLKPPATSPAFSWSRLNRAALATAFAFLMSSLRRRMAALSCASVTPPSSSSDSTHLYGTSAMECRLGENLAGVGAADDGEAGDDTKTGDTTCATRR